jgi:hypothetical protein
MNDNFVDINFINEYMINFAIYRYCHHVRCPPVCPVFGFRQIE